MERPSLLEYLSRKKVCVERKNQRFKGEQFFLYFFRSPRLIESRIESAIISLSDKNENTIKIRKKIAKRFILENPQSATRYIRNVTNENRLNGFNPAPEGLGSYLAIIIFS